MESVLRDLCQFQAKFGEVIALVGNDRPGVVEEEIAGVTVVRSPLIAAPFSVPIGTGWIRYLRRFPADVVVHHEPNPVALLSVLAVRPRSALVIWFHSDIVRQRIFYSVYRPFLRAAMRRAAAIVVASPNLVRFTPALHDFAGKCCVIPFGIHADRFILTPAREARATAIRAACGLPMVLFVGRFAYYKGLEYLVKAMRNVRARLVLVGDGPLAGGIRQLAATIETPGTMEFTGELSEDDLLACLHACDVLALPSVERSEAFGVVQLEAMACGKPVVSCSIPSGVPWVNQHGRTGLLVPPKDPDGLANAINRLLGDPELRKRFGEAGRDRVQQEFTVERMGRAFWDVLVAAREGRIPEAYRYKPHSA
jgi:rhamnosyl/mannosyltransferase